MVAEEEAQSQWDAKKYLPEAAIGCRAMSPGCSREVSGHEQLGGNITLMQPEPQVLHLKVPLSGMRNIFSLHRLLPGHTNQCSGLQTRLTQGKNGAYTWCEI